MTSSLKQDVCVKLSQTVFYPPVPIPLLTKTLRLPKPACQERYLICPPLIRSHLIQVAPSLPRRCPSALTCQMTLCLAQVHHGARLIYSTPQHNRLSLFSQTVKTPMKLRRKRWKSRTITVFTATEEKAARSITKETAQCLKKTHM